MISSLHDDRAIPPPELLAELIEFGDPKIVFGKIKAKHKAETDSLRVKLP